MTIQEYFETVVEVTLPFTISEDGIFGYGHIDPSEFVALLKQYDDHFSQNFLLPAAAESFVLHSWAVKTTVDPDGLSFVWGNYFKKTPEAFPITVILTE